MQELEEIYTDLCDSVSETVLQGADAVTAKVCCTSFLYKFFEFSSYFGALVLFRLLTKRAATIRLPVTVRQSIRLKIWWIFREVFRCRLVLNECQKWKFTCRLDQTMKILGWETELRCELISNWFFFFQDPGFKDELIVDKNGLAMLRPSLDQLKRESADLDIQIRQLQVTVYLFVF